MALDPSIADGAHSGDWQAHLLLYLDKQAKVYVDSFRTRLVEFGVALWKAHHSAARRALAQ
jgi:hypothetical protein